MTGRFQDGELLSDRFRVVRFIAAGGMGEVYEVEDTRLRGVRLALKTILPHIAAEPGMQERFEREVLLARRVVHANLCPIYDIFHCRHGDEDLTFLTMKLLAGETLGSRLMRVGKLLPAEAKPIVEQVASALAAAHGAGVLHRDIKTANIMLQGGGGQVDAVVTDFGLARPTETESTAMTLDGVAGTLGYMAPELLQGAPASTASDMYAFGVVVYKMMTGQSPPVPLGRGKAKSDAALGTVPPKWKKLIGGCLAPEAGLRFQSFAEAVDVLREKPPRSSAWTAKRVAVSSCAAIAVIAAAWFALRGHPRAAITDKDKIVLADFDNKTGDPVFDGTLRQGMTVQLEQSPFLSLITDERVQKTLALMGKAADEKLTPAVGREICQRTGSAAVLDGSIASLGSQYVLGLRALNCESGEVLDAEQVQAARKEDVLAALTKIASQFRAKIGESLTTVQEHNTPLQEATTPSLEALKAYSEGVSATVAGSENSIPLYKRAIEIDPKFAMAYASLGRSYGDVGESALAAESTTQAYELRARASTVERFFIEASYDIVVTGNLTKARETCEAWIRTYPRDVNGHGFLSGMLYPSSGQYEKALVEGRSVIEIDPDAFFGYVNLAASYVPIGRKEDAEKVLELAKERKLDVPDMRVQRYQIAWLRNDAEAMQRVLAQAPKDAAFQEELLVQEAMALAYTGKSKEADNLSERAVNLAVQSGEHERAAGYSAEKFVKDALFGNIEAARQGASVTLTMSKARDIEYSAAFAQALVGDTNKAQALADDLEKRYPEDTQVKVIHLPITRALVALKHHDAATALELLKVNVPYELGVPQCSFIGFYGLLYPVYVRGLAYLEMHRGAEAAAEFQKILDHSDLVVSDPVGAVSRLGLARAYAMAGDTVKAKAAYENFLTLWKDADRDVPVLLQAKTEYARLAM